MSQVFEATAAELNAAVASGGVVIAEFWAPWCTQCKPMSAVVQRLAENLADAAAVLAVNVEAHPAVVDMHDIGTLPALLVFRDGETKTRIDGFKRLPAILDQIRTFV